MAEGIAKIKLKKRTSIVFVLGALAVLTGVIAFMESLVCVVPWCEYQHHRGLLITFSATALLSLAWALVAFRGRRYVIGSMAVLLLAFASVSGVAAAKEFRRYELAEGTKFDGPDMMGAYRSARQALVASGNGEMVIFALSSSGWWNGVVQGYFHAEGEAGTVYGSTGGDGVWTLAWRNLEKRQATPLHDIAEVLEEVGKRRPDMTNGRHRVSFQFCSEFGWSWCGDSFRKGSWQISDDFKHFRMWDANGNFVK